MGTASDTALPNPPQTGALRVLLPPNLAATARRDSIAVKLCAVREALPPLLQDVCRGAGPWLLPLRRTELRALVHLLAGRPVFAWVHRPVDDIPWDGARLRGVSEHLEEPGRPAAANSIPQAAPAATPHPSRASPTTARPRTVGGAPPIAPLPGPWVDGSEHFLAVTLPTREHPAYAPLLEALKTAGFVLEPATRKWWLRDRHRTLGFLARFKERLAAEWGARFTESFRHHTARLTWAEVTVRALDQGASLDIELALQAGGAPAETIQVQLAQGRSYVEHAGRVCLIAAATLGRLAAVQRQFAGDPGAAVLQRSRHRVARARAAEAEAALESVSPAFQAPATWRARSAALRDLTRLPPAALPEALAHRLRGYQRLGVAWLLHLARGGLGAILADEMGLGKTVQALGLLVALREERAGAPPTLIVCPASLVENWRREAALFAPGLRVRVHHGAGRRAEPADWAGVDMVVTSFGTLVRDQPQFAGTTFDCLIVDEAQHAKNRRTQAAQALRAVAAPARFCLTGTPVENSLADLRSLFDIVQPGALAPMPAAVRSEDRGWYDEQLRQQTAHFILRRTKAQVAPELPAKIEQTVWCEATEAQRRCYEEVRATTERAIDALAAAGRSEGQVRLAVLTQLLRLRQVCCDPRLIAPAGDGQFTAADSAKLAAFREILDEAIDDGHRLLVFSQFTSLLALVREELAAREVACCYLDGSMSIQTRQAEVDRFQAEATVPVFLISLKAGGTGLNLTGADVVVHMDPWWNPSVEAQATDRAHRIGQTKVVTSYKLVVAGTVEEKVLQLQEAKRQLLADVFEASEAATAQLELADLRALARPPASNPGTSPERVET